MQTIPIKGTKKKCRCLIPNQLGNLKPHIHNQQNPVKAETPQEFLTLILPHLEFGITIENQNRNCANDNRDKLIVGISSGMPTNWIDVLFSYYCSLSSLHAKLKFRFEVCLNLY